MKISKILLIVVAH